MSKNIMISEGGMGKLIAANKIRTYKDGGGTCLWVPDDTAKLGALTINESGIYRAEKDGLYGYNSVSATCTHIYGKGDDGKEYDVTTDDNGEITKSEMPVEIKVTTMPLRTVYTDGQTIDYTGIVVTAYGISGNVIQIIPFDQLIFPVSTADFSSVKSAEYTDGDGINAILVDCASAAEVSYLLWGKWVSHFTGYIYSIGLGSDMNGRTCTMLKNEPGSTFITRYNGNMYVANKDGDNMVDMASFFDEETEIGWVRSAGSSARAGDGVFVPGGFNYWSDVPESTTDPNNVPITGLHISGAGGQPLPVQWHRNGDMELLETTLYITVAPSPSTGDV